MEELLMIEEECGCRSSAKSGIITNYCEKHDPEGIQKRLEYLEEKVLWLEKLIYDRISW